ncbi:MAG: hypothetical protein ABF718_04585 [Leuconostoc pseudomesenteroides]|uniref:hypothetical protein n=1 Tax=Leuconostoc pseudomesenteroides TaxID=33968 RepID=UPI0039ECD691
MGTYYWFVNGVRQNEGWRQAWNYIYYTDKDGRAVSGKQLINGHSYDFGTNGTYYLKSSGYLYLNEISVANGGYLWLENGQKYTGFRYYMGTYYWFMNGIRQNEGWHQSWGYQYYTDKDGRAVQGNIQINGQAYYFGNNGTYYLRQKN